MLHKFYRKLVPIGVRYKISQIRDNGIKKKALKQLVNMYENPEATDYVFYNELKYIVESGRVDVFPYKWCEEYDNYDIEVHKDKSSGYKYVIHNGKRMYFPPKYSDSFIKKYYCSLKIEQDIRSPHNYFSSGMLEKFSGMIFMDVGAAEGIISLDVVEFVKKVVLFECNEDWIECLKLTFSPWKDKVKIVSKFVGNCTNNEYVKLDDYIFENFSLDCNNPKLILKLDVEGNEKSVLIGAEEILKNKVAYAFVCTYHKENDGQELFDYLKKKGYKVEYSDGYMFRWGGGNTGFRKGLVRATK